MLNSHSPLSSTKTYSPSISHLLRSHRLIIQCNKFCNEKFRIMRHKSKLKTLRWWLMSYDMRTAAYKNINWTKLFLEFSQNTSEQSLHASRFKFLIMMKHSIEMYWVSCTVLILSFSRTTSVCIENFVMSNSQTIAIVCAIYLIALYDSMTH